MENLSLEGKVTLEELEKSLEKSNMKSACGWDGVSYSMIKKVLDLFRAITEGLCQ